MKKGDKQVVLLRIHFRSVQLLSAILEVILTEIRIKFFCVSSTCICLLCELVDSKMSVGIVYVL